MLYNGLPMVLKSADNFIDFKRNCNIHFKNMYDLSGSGTLPLNTCDTKLFSCDTNYSRLEHTTRSVI